MPKASSLPSDELDGPLFRVRSFVITETLNRATGEFGNPVMLPETQFTVVKRGKTIDLMTTQPVLDLKGILRRALLSFLNAEERVAAD